MAEHAKKLATIIFENKFQDNEDPLKLSCDTASKPKDDHLTVANFITSTSPLEFPCLPISVENPEEGLKEEVVSN